MFRIQDCLRINNVLIFCPMVSKRFQFRRVSQDKELHLGVRLIVPLLVAFRASGSRSGSLVVCLLVCLDESLTARLAGRAMARR